MPRHRLVSFIVLLALLVSCGGNASELRILSYNIHHGRGTDGQVDLERIARVIRSVDPDLVALNEVDRGVNRSGKIDQPAELGRLTDRHAVFEKNIDYDGGEYGNAILSRFEVLEHENMPLPSHYEGEQRGMLMVRVQLPARGSVWFAATHLDYRPNDAERIESAATINRLMAGRFAGDRFVLAGDLNATPDSNVVQKFGETWEVARTGGTYPAAEPIKQIDYVLYRPATAFRVVEARVIDEPVASDHRPVLVVLDVVD